MSVIANIKKALPEMQAALPPDIKVNFEFDQSPYVTRAVQVRGHGRGAGSDSGRADRAACSCATGEARWSWC